MKSQGIISFRTRSSHGPHKTMWYSWLGCLVSVFTVLETFSYLSEHPELSVIHLLASPCQPAVLRPGQYRETTGQQYVLDNFDEDESDPDDMGFARDRREERFFAGGLLTLTSSNSPNDTHPIPSIYDPYPKYNSKAWKRKYHGKFKPCLGPRGDDLDRSRTEDMMLVYRGQQTDFPQARFGSYSAMGLDGDVCTDRYSRFGAYGYDEDSIDGVPGFTRPASVSWDDVDWRDLQSMCFQRNSGRYRPGSEVNYSQAQAHFFEWTEPPRKDRDPDSTPFSRRKQYHARSAVLIRASHDMIWTPNHREYLRALIMELVLHSGAEYELFLLIHVRDDEMPIYSDAKTMERLRKSIPKEFRKMALFFNARLLEAWYPKVGEHSPVLQHHQPIEIFSQIYPNFDYYWQLEMDSRLVGHAYHFFDKAVSFARQQPRKYLWERNAYFYTPGVHGIWDEFQQMVDESLADRPENTIWGAPYGTGIRPLGPEAALQGPENDNYTWGVEEEADLITFLPIFNPKDTDWTFPDQIWNFRHGLDTPRRASVITMGRYSKRLLDFIHNAQASRGLGLASEMTGPSWALFHGLKAVTVPHPIYADGQWTPQELVKIYNRGEAENINGGPDSIWNFDHAYDHIMYRLSYMFTTHTAEDLYRRWMGYRTAQYEGGKKSTEMQYGRHCFPFMFLHTVKNTEARLGKDKAVP